MNFFKGKNRIDIDEKVLKDTGLLSILLLDRSSGKNIIWATDTYLKAPEGKDRYRPTMEITEDKIFRLSKEHSIKPRCIRVKEEQKKRTKDKAEVFTPSWVCNKQNNSIDNQYGIYFNDEIEKDWTNNRIDFKNATIDWRDYIKLTRLEITCGEAPYIVSRYDTVTGEYIEPNCRIGMLDRKLRVINHYINEEKDWIIAVIEAYRSVYGYEWQGDSLLLARENLLATLFDYYNEKFGHELDFESHKQFIINIAEIISWNIWQMDGLKCVVPMSCTEPSKKKKVFDELRGLYETLYEEVCPGCKEDVLKGIENSYKEQKAKEKKVTIKEKGHDGILCKIMNWETGQTEYFVQSVYDEPIKGTKKLF